MSNEWVKTKGYEREKDPAYPGVWRLRQGGFLIRGRVKSDKTGKMLEVMHAVEAPSAAAARVVLDQELAALAAGPAKKASRRRFQEFAFSVFEDRVTGGEIRSAATRRHWGSILQSLLVPHPEGFGDVFVDAITFEDIAAWRKRQAALMRPSTCRACSGEGKRTQRGTLSPCGWCSGKGTRAYNPRTLNQAIAKLRTLLKEAHVQRLIAEDLSAHLKPFPTDTYKTYTEEQPNSLTPEEAVSFLGAIWKRFPQWYALTVLGMSTGRRPSELRPLRKGGETPDLIFLADGTAKLYVRRSHTDGKSVMEKTKTDVSLSIALPPWLAQVLRWHIDRARGPQAESEFLFPARSGEVLDNGSMARPFDLAAKDAGITKRITPRALRRSYQDLQRAVKTPDVITRSISGHLTEQMHHHYSTVSSPEQVEALDRMGQILHFPDRGGCGEKGGEKEPQKAPEKQASDGNAA